MVEWLPQIDESEQDVRYSVIADKLNELKTYVNQLSECFDRPTAKTACTLVTKMCFDLTTDDIVKYWPCGLPHSETEVVRGMVKVLGDADITKSNSNFTSATLLDAKKTEEKTSLHRCPNAQPDYVGGALYTSTVR